MKMIKGQEAYVPKLAEKAHFSPSSSSVPSWKIKELEAPALFTWLLKKMQHVFCSAISEEFGYYGRMLHYLDKDY